MLSPMTTVAFSFLPLLSWTRSDYSSDFAWTRSDYSSDFAFTSQSTHRLKSSSPKFYIRCSEAALGDPSVFLRALMSSQTPRESKSKLFSNLQDLREMDEAAAIQFLDLVVGEVDKISSNRIAMMKWPVPFPSYRMKLGCLKRMLDDLVQDEPTDNRRRRSAVAQLLRQLQEGPGVWKLEREYERKKKAECSMDEMLARTPPDLETPKYEVLLRKKNWEVREYQNFSVCSFNMEGQTNGSAFNALAGYIFGKNQVLPQFRPVLPCPH